MSARKLVGPWTVVIDRSNGHVMEVLASNEPTCGGGPDSCGGCHECMGPADPTHYETRSGLSDDELAALCEAAS